MRELSVASARQSWPVVRETHQMTDAKDEKLALFALYQLYLTTAEKVSERRAQANSWMLSVNGAIVALYGYLQADKAIISTGQKAVWIWAIPAAGAIMCVAWATLLTSYRKLNRAKFEVLMQLENELPIALFTREQDLLVRDKRRSLSTIETAIPACFILLYAVMCAAALLA